MAQSILLVDDDDDTLTLLGIMLERRGYEVLKARSGPEALDQLMSTLPDLVLLDVMMPEMDGYEVCQAIKASPRTSQLPIVILSARAYAVNQLEGFRAGAIDYITKPISSRELIARIRAVLDRALPASPPGKGDKAPSP